MKLICAKNYDEMSRRAANVIAAVVTLKPNAVLGLATGSTPIGMYQKLAERCRLGDLDFEAIKTVNLDEYVGLPMENDQSYHYFMKENLFSHINIKMENTNVPNGLAPDMEAECARYDRYVASLGGVDLQLLGIGNNGHIGFNEPADVFQRGTNLVNLTQRTREANARFFATLDAVPKQAVTMGIQTILYAKTILLEASGEGKSDILYEALFGPITPRVPASVLQLHPNLIVVADEEACRKIKEECPAALQ